MGARRLTSSLVVAAVLAGCAIALPPPREPVEEPARQAIALLVARWHRFTDLTTLADIRLERGFGGRQQLTGALLVKAPASVRFEALSPLGQPVLLAVVHDGQLLAYDATTNEAVEAPATAEVAARLLNLPFDADDLAAVLSGHAVPPKDIRVATLLPADAHGRSLSVIGTFHEQRIWMDLETGIVHRVQIIGGRTDATVTFARDGAGQLTGFDLDTAQALLRGTVRYVSPRVGAGIEPDRFRLTLPKGAKLQTVR